jgi:hypothetical protein
MQEIVSNEAASIIRAFLCSIDAHSTSLKGIRPNPPGDPMGRAFADHVRPDARACAGSEREPNRHVLESPGLCLRRATALLRRGRRRDPAGTGRGTRDGGGSAHRDGHRRAGALHRDHGGDEEQVGPRPDRVEPDDPGDFGARDAGGDACGVGLRVWLGWLPAPAGTGKIRSFDGLMRGCAMTLITLGFGIPIALADLIAILSDPRLRQ